MGMNLVKILDELKDELSKRDGELERANRRADHMAQELEGMKGELKLTNKRNEKLILTVRNLEKENTELKMECERLSKLIELKVSPEVEYLGCAGCGAGPDEGCECPREIEVVVPTRKASIHVYDPLCMCNDCERRREQENWYADGDHPLADK